MRTFEGIAHGRAKPQVLAPEQKLFHIETFPFGAISEVVRAGPVAGILLKFAELLGEPEEVSPRPELELIDGADGFDLDSFEDVAGSKLLWVRCHSALEMAKAADLLIHEGNLPFILLRCHRPLPPRPCKRTGLGLVE